MLRQMSRPKSFYSTIFVVFIAALALIGACLLPETSSGRELTYSQVNLAPAKNNLCFDNPANNEPTPAGIAFSTPVVTTNDKGFVIITWTTTAQIGGGNAYPIEMRVRTRTYNPQAHFPCGGMGINNFNDGAAYSDPIALGGQPNHTYAIEQIGARKFTFKDLTSNTQSGTVTIPDDVNTGGGLGFSIEQLFTLNGAHSAVYYFPFQSQGSSPTPTPTPINGDCEPVPVGLVSWWAADGNANDVTGENNGTTQNGLAFGTGFVNQAYSLDGVDDYINILDSASLRAIKNAITVNGWINPQVPPAPPYGNVEAGRAAIFARRNPNDRESFELDIRADGRISVIVGTTNSSTSVFVSLNSVIQFDNQWKHVAATVDTTTGVAKAYVNGQEVPLTTEFGPTTFSGQLNTVGDLFIGRRQDISDIGGVEGAGGAAYYKGLIDEVDLFNRALSGSEIQSIFNAGSKGKCKSNGLACGLGISWDETEGEFTGVWTRRGVSEVFDAVWTNGSERVAAVLTITVKDGSVNIARRQDSGGNDCDYIGTVGADGVTVQGTYRCTKFSAFPFWRARINCNVPSPQLRPLIFIPGIAGSSLRKLDGTQELWPGVLTNHNQLSLDPSSPGPEVFAADVLRQLQIKEIPVSGIYEPLLKAFKTGGYTEDGTSPTLFVFPYDWRKSNTENAVNLRTFVNHIRTIHQNSDVNIVAHSMGGLLARRYIVDNPDSHHVDKLVTIGSPWLGAPKVLLTLETGEFFDGIQQLLTRRTTLKQLVEFFPGAHELMPSPAYFELGGRPFAEEGWDVNNSGNDREIYNYEQFHNLFNLRHPRSNPSSASLRFHEPKQDDWRQRGFNVRYYNIYGVKSRADTIGQVVSSRPAQCRSSSGIGRICIPFTNNFNVKLTLGDGTVPLVSATRRGAGKNYNADNAEIIRVSSPSSATDDSVEHLGLTKTSAVQQRVLSILNSNQPAEQPSTNLLSQEDDPVTQQAYYLKVAGAASARLTDAAGNSSDLLSDEPSAGLPTVTSHLLAPSSFLVITPTDQNYTMTFVTGIEPLIFEITKGTDVDTAQAIKYLDLNLPPNTRMRIQITPEGVGTLDYDSNGDGTFETPVTPTASISGAAAQDLEPPTVNVSEARHQTGMLVTLGASDSGSGVKALLYSIDGTNYQPYTSPFNVDPYRNPIVYAFAEDNVANRSSLTTFQLTAPASTLQFGVASYTVNEGDGHATITVSRVGDTLGTATIAFQTVDDPAAVPCNPAFKKPDGSSYPQGNAYARCDYATSVETLTFPAGNTQPKTIAIPIIDDAYVEGSETVQLRLLNPVGATLSLQSTITLTITDNDSAAGPNPIFTTPFFVRMQYLDFLSREPEAGEPWSGVLNRCSDVNNNPLCDRTIVSQSFFGSPEFRLKGFFVYNFYSVALNRRPTYEEIIPDMRSVSGETEQDVYQKRAAFPVGFTGRTEFKDLYDAMSNADFVNTLLNRYGLQQITAPDPASPEGSATVTLTRADLISRLNAQSLTHAQVLRAIVESNEIGAAEYNRAFVAMQYYGYLRRTPEEDGYQAWLRVITQDPNNVRIMVNGFMNSPEYKLRFGNPSQ